MFSTTDRTAGETPLRRNGVTLCGVWLTVPKLHDVLCDGCRMAKRSLVYYMYNFSTYRLT